jgi:L-ribulose-5-phosphate 3-epimerase
MKLGVIISLTERIEEEMDQVVRLGLPTCQVNCWNPVFFTPQMAERVKAAAAARGLEISAFWCGWEGPAVWDQMDGPLTLGLVPLAYRYERLKMLLRGADFTAWLGVKDMVTHVGFIPENPNDPDYRSLVSSLRYLVQYCRGRGVNFLFETGQETPVTILRAIEDIGLDNIGVNLDPANLILYGKGNPVDALDVFGRYVRGVHAKDGLYPTSGRLLGREVALGEGKVDFPRLVAGLKRLGYRGALTIEREISGPEQERDILKARDLLAGLIQQGEG